MKIMEISPGASKTKGNNKPREKKLATSGKRLTTNEATRHTLATVILELTAALQGARSPQLETVFRSATHGATDARTAGQITRRENFHVVNASLPFGVLTLKTLYQYKLKLNYNRGTIFQLGVPLSNTIYHFKHVSNECKHGLGQNLSQRTRTAPKAFTHGNPCLHSLPKPQIFTCHHSNLTPHNFSLNPITSTICPQHIKPPRLQPTIPIIPKKVSVHQHNSPTYHTKSIHTPIRHHATNTHNPPNKRDTHANRRQRQTSACTTVKNNTITPSTQNIEKIHATKQPHNRKTLRSFLKAVNVYKEFIPDHARLRTPLINLLKKDIMWVWDDECQKAFTNLKENLTTHPTLHLYQEGLPCQVYCNTSTFSITGILKQVYPDGKTYTVQHFSRSLRSHERNCSDLELQCLAIVESVDNFRTCLNGRKFTIFSDHPALQWLKEIKAPSGRLFRWRLRLSRYEYEVRSINGVQQYETGVGTRIPFCGFLDAPLIQSQQSSPPRKSRVTMDHNKLRTVSRKGVLKTIVPSSLTTRLLKSVHTQHHHPNISKMTRLISAQYYWQNMTQDIAKQVKTCPTCRFARRIDEYNQPSRKNTDTGTKAKQNSYIKHSVHTTQPMPKLPHPRQRNDHTSQPKPITADISLIKPLTIKQENCKPDNQLNHITPLPKDIKQENCEPTNHSNSTINKEQHLQLSSGSRRVRTVAPSLPTRMVETRSGKMQDPAQERIKAEESAKPQPGATIGGDASSDPVVLNPNIDIPKYDGTEDPRPWIESLEEIGFLYHWADYIISRYAAMNMIGSAKTWLNLHKVSFTSWENFKSRLIENFASDANKEEMRMRLNRIQQWNEPAIRFAEDILVLCNKVDPQMEEETKINWVIGGLKKEHSFALHLNPPKNTNELLEICKKLDLFEKNYQERVEKSKALYNGPRSPRSHHQEQWKNAPSFRRPYQNTSKPQAPAPRYYQNTSKPQAPTPRYYQNKPLPQVSAPRRPYTPNPEPKPVYPSKTYNKSPNSNRNRTEDGRPICFKCNKPGHVARYCRVRFVRIVEEDPIVTQDKVEEEIRMDNGTEKSRPLLYADVSNSPYSSIPTRNRYAALEDLN
ncbi:hypothetical protein LAZ67_21001999 [Cordylochernes scorpioides]|uniref:RNA-directed DNA polymerase n=1 Tax=Cordylochernes scorpioides TaxID=51811 RepID=A0ABY6LPA6_9ARAC|nr:hypothetical protein LAZ67_21001999 [Cordylochernes scorpioides]